MGTYVVDQIFEAKAIRDTKLYYTDVSNCIGFPVITFFVINETDQDATVQIMANMESTYMNAVNVGSALTVSAGTSESATLTPDTTGWLPFVMATVRFSTAPTKGTISVRVIKAKFD